MSLAVSYICVLRSLLKSISARLKFPSVSLVVFVDGSVTELICMYFTIFVLSCPLSSVFKDVNVYPVLSRTGKLQFRTV